MKKGCKITCYILSVIIIILISVLVVYLQTTFTVTFDTKGGTIYKSIEVKPLSIIERPNDPVMEGYTFEGWYLEGTNEEFDFSKEITDDTVLIAIWKPVV